MSLLAFLSVLILTKREGLPAVLANIPIRLDPLGMLAQALATRLVLTGSLLALSVILLTIVFGRVWCGWLCPLGTTLDLFPFKSRHKGKAARREGYESLRTIKYILLLAILLAALFGNLTLLVFDPITIYIRTFGTSIWPVLGHAVTAFESLLYQVHWLAGPITRFDAWLRPAILPYEAAFYREALLYAGIFALVIGLNWMAPRFWCRYICPLGGLLGFLSKFAIFQRRIGEACRSCVLCTQSCPTGTIDPAKAYASDPAECTMCMDCQQACPRGAIRFSPALPAPLWAPYDPNRGKALAVFGSTLLALALFKSDGRNRDKNFYLIRPPGSNEKDLLSQCIRCGECVRTCPTNGLQPAITESGIEGLWTPIVIPRLGYCDYSCNACGQICPVEAIPSLNLEEKRMQVIGKAYIDQNRCIAWSDHLDCIVCEEMCPLPDKAIRLENGQFTDEEGESRTILLPHVLRDLCIGCGICEYKCPVSGEAAIRVHIPNAEVLF
jgi:polyferredoxin